MKSILPVALVLWLLVGCSPKNQTRDAVQSAIEAHTQFEQSLKNRVKRPWNFLNQVDATKCPNDFRAAWNNYIYLQKKVGGDSLAALASIPATQNYSKFHDATWESRDAWQQCLNVAAKYGAFEHH
jgi:hypothetical protein